MRRRGLSSLAVFVMTACATTTAATTPQPSPQWSVGVSTSGGFAGRGRGSVSVSSDGKLVANPPSRGGAPQQVRACETALDGDDLRRIEAAVARAAPAGWRTRKPDLAAPDAFGYTLTLVRADGQAQASWHDNTRDLLPADLAELYAGVEAAWNHALTACRR
jgi:hypothetical protein